MKKLIYLIFINLLFITSIYSQNRLWTNYDSYSPYKDSPTLQASANLFGDSVIYHYSNDTLTSQYYGPTPTGMLLVSNYNNSHYSTYIDYEANEHFLLEYDRVLNQNTSLFIFDQNIHLFGTLVELSDSCLLGFYYFNNNSYLYKFNTNTDTIEATYFIDSITQYYYLDIKLILANDGNYYSNFTHGGLNNNGFIFMFDVANDTVVKKIDYSSSTEPTGSLFKTKDNRLFGTTSDKIYEYDYTNNTITTVYQNSSNIPRYIIEGNNQEFFGYLDQKYIVKINLNTNTDIILFDCLSLPYDVYYYFGGYYFSGYPTVTSNGDVIGFITVDEWQSQNSGSKTHIYFLDYLSNDYYYFYKKDFFISKFGKFIEICYPDTVNITQIILDGDSALLGGAYQYTDGNYYDTYTNFCGKDSLVITNLVIADILTQDTITICEGDTAYFNQTAITQSGVYYETYSTLAGDSISSIVLIVNASYYFDAYYDICDGDSVLFFNEYYGIGNYQINNSTTYGCDSIINLEINNISAEAIIGAGQDYYTNITYNFGSPPYYISGYNREWYISPSSYDIYYPFGYNSFAAEITFLDNVEYTITLVLSNSCGSDTTSITIQVLLGVEEIANTSQIKVYPNPANDFIYFVSDSQSSIEHIEIFNIAGELVNSILYNGKTQKAEIDISNFKSGVYQFAIYNKEGYVYFKKIVKIK